MSDREPQEITENIALIDAQALIGRQARLTANPETVGHIVRVITEAGGRHYVLSYWWDGGLEEVVLEAFQLELV